MSETTTSKYNAGQMWLSKDSGLIDVELAEGVFCQAKRLEMEDIIEMNLIDDLDTFTGLFDDDGEDSANQTELDFIKRLSQGTSFDRLKATLDKITVHTLVQPKVLPKPGPGEDRLDGKIYVDAIGFMDKMNIFNSVFDGLSGMSDFRQEPASGVGAVEEKPIVEAAPL